MICINFDSMDQKNNAPFSFQKSNYRLLLIGLVINVLGFLLMIGGGAKELDHFDANEIFSPIRITLAPFLIVAGYVVILISIMRKPKAK